MTYRIHLFGDVRLPDRMPEDTLDTGNVETSLLDSIGGVFDYWGDGQRAPRRQNIPFRGLYIGEYVYEVDHLGNYIVDHLGNRIVWGTAESVLTARIDKMLSARGAQAKLWRQRELEDALQWKTARLLNVDYTRTIDDAGAKAEMSGVFETRQAGWHAQTQATTTATMDSDIQALTVRNGGELRVDDAQIVIVGTGTDITSVKIEYPAAGIDLRYTGTIASGETLTIDCDAKTVQLGSADAYSDFARGSAHTARGWLPLEPGNNPFMVTVTGQGTVSVKHFDQWA